MENTCHYGKKFRLGSDYQEGIVVRLHVLSLKASVTAMALMGAAADARDADKPTRTVQEVVVSANQVAQNVEEFARSIGAQTGAGLERNKLDQLFNHAACISGISVASAGTPKDAYITVGSITQLSSGSSVATSLNGAQT